MKKIIAIVAVIVVAVGLVSLGWFGKSYSTKRELETASKQAEAYVRDIVAGNPIAAYKVTSQPLRDIQSEEQFTEEMKNLKSDAPEYGNATIVKADDGTMLFVQSVEGLPQSESGSTSGQFTISLVNNGGWKVNSSTVN